MMTVQQGAHGQRGDRVGVQAIFLDRDGVINENRQDHVKSWDEFVFVPGAVEAIARVSRAHVPVFVISNADCVVYTWSP